MTAEHQTEINESGKKWHAGLVTKIVGFAVAPVFLGASVVSAFFHEPQLTRDFASLSLISECLDGAMIMTDAYLGSMEKKLKETQTEQKSS